MGLASARGEYIQFIDDDDYLVQNALQLEIENLRETNADLLHFNYFVTSSTGELNSSEKRLQRSYVPEGTYVGDDKMKLLFLGKISHFSWIFIGKKYIFSEIDNHLPVGRLFEDFATIYKWVNSAEKLAVLNQKLYGYVQRSNSIMHQPKLSHASDIEKTVDELDEFSEQYFHQLLEDVVRYKMPRLLNAYGISLKVNLPSKNLTSRLRRTILIKINIVGFNTLNSRDKLKIMMLKINILQCGYKYKNYIKKFRGNKV